MPTERELDRGPHLVGSFLISPESLQAVTENDYAKISAAVNATKALRGREILDAEQLLQGGGWRIDNWL